MDKNRDVYESAETVKCYSHDSYIFEPEKKVIENIGKVYACERMLDIGMGAGRTTFHFSSYFKSYVGLDYSKTMVDITRNRFIKNENCKFEHGDARNMTQFKDDTFDFVLFSFNGIDCVSLHDRIQVLNEIHRVARNEGIFFFSFHNSYSIPKLFSFQFPKNPFKYYNEFKRFKGVNSLNNSPKELLINDFVSIKDGDWDFKAEYVYAKPEAQVAQLMSCGFIDIKLFELKNGNIIEPESNMSFLKDDWVHISCRVKKKH